MPELDSVFSDDWNEDHRSGIVAVIGRPNVGKSTLVNAVIGQKIAIVTAKPQTTRRRQLGIYTSAEAQILLVDTPGLHKPRTRLGDYMVAAAQDALRDADAVLWILDASQPPTAEDGHIAESLSGLDASRPLLLALNKMDLVAEPIHRDAHLALREYHSAFEISAAENRGIDEMLRALIQLLPVGPRYYPAEQVSEVNWRFIASEIIREKIIEATSDEIPHCVAIEINRYREKARITLIEATVYVERDSQKGIVIGKGGRMIKAVGMAARNELEALLQVQVHLETRVKVLKNWRSNERMMRRLGYPLPKRKAS